MGGQFFFLAGLYAAFDALDESAIIGWKLVLTGVLWAAAIGSRITQILPVGFMTIMIIWAIIAKPPRTGFFTRAIRL